MEKEGVKVVVNFSNNNIEKKLARTIAYIVHQREKKLTIHERNFFNDELILMKDNDNDN